MTLRGEHVVCFGPTDWWHHNPSCTTHLMRALARENRVLYVNPFSTDLPAGLSRGLGRRALRKARSLLGFVRRAAPALHTYSPVFLPVQGDPRFDRLNNAFLRWQLRSVMRVLGVRPTLIWYENPRAADLAPLFPGVPTLFHVSDAFSDSAYLRDKQAFRLRESWLTQHADVLVCVSRALYERKRAERGAAVHLLPHGVDHARFAAAGARGGRIPELADVEGPVAGYYGTLTAQNDVELLEYCARNLPHVTFVFAGSVTAGDYRRLEALPNTRFLGFLPYERMPELAASFDVCLLPWRRTEWIRHCNPLKFMEYMAAGRPVVSVPIPQVAELGGELVRIADSPEAFADAIASELERDTPERRSARSQLAAEHGWERKVTELSELITPHLGAAAA